MIISIFRIKLNSKHLANLKMDYISNTAVKNITKGYALDKQKPKVQKTMKRL